MSITRRMWLAMAATAAVAVRLVPGRAAPPPKKNPPRWLGHT